MDGTRVAQTEAVQKTELRHGAILVFSGSRSAVIPKPSADLSIEDPGKMLIFPVILDSNFHLQARQMNDMSAEFKSLRDEIHLRIRNRMWLLSLPAVFVGINLTVTKDSDGPFGVLLLGSLVCFFVSLEWAYNDCRIADIAVYIKHFIERQSSDFHWQTYLSIVRKGDVDWAAQWAALGVFVGLGSSCIVAWVLKSYTNEKPPSTEVLLAALCSLAVLAIPWQVFRRSRHVVRLEQRVASDARLNALRENGGETND